MIFVLLGRIIRRHSRVHLTIPLGVVAIVAAVVELASAQLRGRPPDFGKPWLWARVPELVSVYVSFALVIFLSVKKAGDVRTTRVDKLRDVLPGSSRYFAIGTIPLREWFEPNSQLYLANIIRHQHDDSAFKHERVLLFYTNRDWQALQASYLDEPYAKAFAAIHNRFKIPLAYVGPEDIRRILIGLNDEALCVLGCQRKLMVFFGRWLTRLPREWTIRRRPRMLPFALIENHGVKTVLHFSKHANTLTLNEAGKDTLKAHEEFVAAIEDKIHDSNHRLKEEFKFSNYLFPGGCE